MGSDIADNNRTDCAARAFSPMDCWDVLEDVFCPSLFVVTSALALDFEDPGALMPITVINRSHVSPLTMAFVPISAI